MSNGTGSGDQSVIQKHFSLGLGALVMILFTAYAFAVTFWHPIADPTIIGMILGILGTGGFGVVMSYFFGSSTGSSSKDAVIKEVIDKGALK